MAKGPLLRALNLGDNELFSFHSNVTIQAIDSGLRLVAQTTDPQLCVTGPFHDHFDEGSIVEVRLRATSSSVFQILWDVGAGFSEDDSRTFPISAGVHRLSCSIPPGVVTIRFDPLNSLGQLDVFSVGFYARRHRAARLFPFEELLRNAGPAKLAWLGAPALQQAICDHLLGPGAPGGWPGWLFRELAVEHPRVLHLGYLEPSFALAVMEDGFVRDYVGVPVGDMLNRNIMSGLTLLDLPRALARGPYDVILSTGYASSSAGTELSWHELADALDDGGQLVLLDRLRSNDPALREQRAQLLERVCESFPLSYQQDLADQPPEALLLDAKFRRYFRDARTHSLGGALVAPVATRLRRHIGNSSMLAMLLMNTLLLERVAEDAGRLYPDLALVFATKA